jgi:two-component system, NtrC family, nitrogen regulation sensor histidine kinase NtrY
MTADIAASRAPFARRLLDWARRAGLSRKLAIALAIAAVASGVATYVVITDQGFTPNPRTVLFLQLLNLILLLLLGAVVARRIVLIWVERRRGLAGSKLHVQLVVLFSAVAVAPAIVMAVFSALFFNLGIEAWFSERTRVALRESLAVAAAYLDEHRNVIRADILAMASDLDRELQQATSQVQFRQLVDGQVRIRSLHEAVVFDEQGRILASVNLLQEQSGVVPPWALEQARSGQLVIFSPDDGDTQGGEGLEVSDRVRALLRLQSFSDVYLMVGRGVDPKVSGHFERTREAVDAYVTLEGRRTSLQVQFAATFVGVALLLLFVAIWVGLVLATRLAQPIAELVGAAERVRAGDLDARVMEQETTGEIASLARAFNRMTSQLASQRRELVEANRQVDDRRRFTEAVLSGVSSGVIGLDAEGRVTLPNRAALQLLSIARENIVGADFRQAVPEMATLLDAVRATPDRAAQDQISILRDGRRRALLVRIASQPLESGERGFVVTFDDITELEAAQRKAAWSDVARRIAHEIKNPLTPIQLSAERLKRKYMSEIKSDPETFRICTETIVRQVGDIGRMVDEFSSFARMPAPQMRDEDLAELVRQTVFLQRNARPEIRFDAELPETPVRLNVDPRQIGQALTNLLQNAIDAIEGREPPADGTALPAGHVTVRLVERDGRVVAMVDDNGKGLPRESRERLTEPYMTTRAKGTGLGLAIVKKIMEDHAGELILEDGPEGGTRVSLVFAPTPNRDTPGDNDSTAAAMTTKAAVHGA